LGERFSQVEILALYHHAPEACTWSRLAKLVTLADRLSSGEREPLPEEESSGKVSETPLTCLFTKLEGAKGPLQDFPMRALEPDLTPWFSPGPSAYVPLWEAFNQDVAGLSKDVDSDLLFHQLLALLEKYTLFMPAAAYRDRPDISLFHHIKATAAMAACLYDLEVTEDFLDKMLGALKGLPASQSLLEQTDFLLVAADISGIQDFIYSVTSEKAFI
jgi:CRISPR-associated protein Csm1